MTAALDWAAVGRRLQKSDRNAFEEIYRHSRRELYQFVFSIIHDASVTHDLVQDVFVSVWELRATLDPERSIRALIFRIARNRAFRHLRDSKLHVEKHEIIKMNAEQPSFSLGEDKSTVDAEVLTQCLTEWLTKMPTRQKEAIVLSRFHSLSHQEISQIMKISPRTVNNHIVRALEFLRDRIMEFEPTLLQA